MTKFISRKSAPAPSPLALRSPQQYLELIKKVYPAWVASFPRMPQKSMSGMCALAASAVAMGNACRISEILGLKCRQLAPNGTAIVLGSKGSNARMIWTGFDPETIAYLRTLPPDCPVFPVNYMQCWRLLAACGLGVQEPGHAVVSRTHAGRYELAAQANAIGGAGTAGQVLGHKSKTAEDYYINPQKAASARRRRMRQNLTQHGPNLEDFINLD